MEAALTLAERCPPHHWHITPSRGPWSAGYCLKCYAATRWFNNYFQGNVFDIRSGTNFAPSQPMTLAYLARTCHVWEQE